MASSRSLPRGSLVWLVFAACSVPLLWLASNARFWDAEVRGGTHYYEYLAEGFLQGHTYLSVDPAPELMALPDPYDPSANANYRYLDASYFRGRYYLYFGPTPALLLLAPVKALTGWMIPQRYAVACFAIGGLWALALLTLGVRERYFPSVGEGRLAACFLFAMPATWLPVTMAASKVWELAIVAEVALLWWGFYFLWRYHAGGRRLGWALGLGAAGVFAMGARPTALFPAAALLAGLSWSEGGWFPHGASRRNVVAAAALVASGGLGLLAYNQVRFGSPFDFGHYYQLWGADYRTTPHFSLGYFLFNLRTYLLGMPELTAYFPFVHGTLPLPRPAGYIGGDEPCGVLFAVPLVAISVLALVAVRRGRIRSACPALTPLVLVGAVATVLSWGVLCLFGGACSRYITELLYAPAVLSIAGLLVAAGGAGRWAWRGVALAGAWGVVAVGLLTFSFGRSMSWSAPGAYQFLSRELDRPALWYARHTGQTFGPVHCQLHLEPTFSGVSVLAQNGLEGQENLFLVRSVDSRHVRLEFDQRDDGSSWVRLMSEPIAIDSGPIDLRFEAPWLYPPAGTDYWDQFPEQTILEKQTCFTISTNATAVKFYSKDHHFIALNTEFFVGPTRLSPSAWLVPIRR